MEKHMLFADKVMSELDRQPGAPDRPVAEALGCRVQQVNNECRYLVNLGRLERKKNSDGLIGNWPVRTPPKLTIVERTRLKTCRSASVGEL
jgi:hypothetical protein